MTSKIDKATRVKDEPWLWWNTFKLVNDWVAECLADQAEHPESYDEPKTDHDFEEEVKNNPYFFQEAWDELTDALTDWMDGYKYWHCEGRNIGWRRVNGYRDFKAEDGEQLLQEILPDTECTFNIYESEGPKMLEIRNYHHDSPTGEVYIVTPVDD